MLGPIIWDFTALSMVLWFNGRAHHWSDLSGGGAMADAIIDPRIVLEELLWSFEDIFDTPHGLPPQCR